MNPLSAIPLHIKLIFLAAALAVAFSVGWSVNGWRLERRIEADRAAAAEALVKQKEGYDDVSRFLVRRYLEQEGKTRVVYRTIKEKVYEATSGAVCLGSDAVSLWNASLTGYLPDAAPGAPEAAGGSGQAGVTDREVLGNAIENNEQYRACRGQLNALIDWHEVALACQKQGGDLERCVTNELNRLESKERRHGQ